MATPSNVLAPIKAAGYLFSGTGVAGIAMHFMSLHHEEYAMPFQVLVIGMSSLHILIGAGIWLKRTWGLHALKAYFHLLYFGFPIGNSR
jgi:predicted transporter